jgi:excisionase family DNA binding protein
MSRKRVGAYVKSGILNPQRESDGTLQFPQKEVCFVARFTVTTTEAAQFLSVKYDNVRQLSNMGYLTPLVTPIGWCRYDPAELALTKAHLDEYLLTYCSAELRFKVPDSWLRGEVAIGHLSYVKYGMRTHLKPQEVRQHVQSCYGLRMKEAAEFLGVSVEQLTALTIGCRIPHLRGHGGHRRFREGDLKAYLENA